MRIIFSAFWITLIALVKAAMVIAGTGFALFMFVLAIFAVLAYIAIEMADGVRAI